MWHIHTIEYFSAITTNEVLIQAMTWVNLENSMLSERGQSKRPHIVWFHLYKMCRRGKSIEMESRLTAAMTRGRMEWGGTVHRYGFLFWVTKYSEISGNSYTTQHTLTPWIIYFRRVNFVVCELLTNFKRFYNLFLDQFLLLIWERGREGGRKRERNKHTPICCSTYLRTHWWILICALKGIKTAALANGDDALTHWVPSQGLYINFLKRNGFMFSLGKQMCFFSNFETRS